jgi:hypothetical protein
MLMYVVLFSLAPAGAVLIGNLEGKSRSSLPFIANRTHPYELLATYATSRVDLYDIRECSYEMQPVAKWSFIPSLGNPFRQLRRVVSNGNSVFAFTQDEILEMDRRTPGYWFGFWYRSSLGK